VVADVDVEGGQETIKMIKEQGGEGLFVKADVSKSAEVQNMIKAAVDKYGRMDVIFNNAGIDGEIAITHECTEENYDKIVATNLKGVFLGMKYGIIQMLKQGGGVIVNTSSGVAELGFAGMPAYCAAKAGVCQLTRVAAVEYGKQNIRVNCIEPGLMLTPMALRILEEHRVIDGTKGSVELLGQQMPMGRGSQPEEVAHVALFLASDESSYIHGAMIAADGGWTAKICDVS